MENKQTANNNLIEKAEEKSDIKEFSHQKHNILLCNLDDEKNKDIANVPVKSNLSHNMRQVSAETMDMYVVNQTDICSVRYRTTFDKYSENDCFSLWKCNRYAHMSTDKCMAFLKVQDDRIISNHDGLNSLHTCRFPKSLLPPHLFNSIVKNRLKTTRVKIDESPSSTNTASTHVKVYGRKRPSSSSTFSEVNQTVNTGTCFDQIDAITRTDKSAIKRFYVKVDMFNILVDVYEFLDYEFTGSAPVFHVKDNLDLVFYKDKTYRRYLPSFYDNHGLLNIQYRCCKSDCGAELRLIRDAPDSAYVLKFKHHTCLKSGTLGDIVIQRNQSQFYETLLSDKHRLKPMVYFNGNLYKFQNQRYTCHQSRINNCPAYLIFCYHPCGIKHLLKVGSHTCKHTFLEINQDSSSLDVKANDLSINPLDIESNYLSITFTMDNNSSGDEQETYNLKRLLESSIKANKKIGNLKKKFNKNDRDLDNNPARAIPHCKRIKLHDTKDDKEKKTEDEISVTIIKSLDKPTKPQQSELFFESQTIKHTTKENAVLPTVDQMRDQVTRKVRNHKSNKMNDQVDYVTEEQIYNWNYTTPVRIKKLGYVLKDIPKVDPNDPTTVYFFMSCLIKPLKKLLHYMGYNYFSQKNKTRYMCVAPSCIAWVELKNRSEKIVVSGPHTCTSVINNTSQIIEKGPSESQAVTVCSLVKIKQEKDSEINESLEVEHPERSDIINDVTDEITIKKEELRLDEDTPLDVMTIGEAEETNNPTSSINTAFYSSLKVKEEKGGNAREDLQIECEERTCFNTDISDDISIVKEELRYDKETKMDIIAVNDALEVNNHNIGKTDVHDVSNQFNNNANLHLHSLIYFKNKGTEGLEKYVSENEIKLESENSPEIHIIDDDSSDDCFVEKQFFNIDTQVQATIDMTLDEDSPNKMIEGDIGESLIVEQRQINSQSNTAYNIKDNNPVMTADADDSSDDTPLITYKGYQYEKEYSGKFAWCKESKICSAAIKLLPNNKREVIGRHTCNSFEKNIENDKSYLSIDDKEETVRVDIKTISNNMKSIPYIKDQTNYKISFSDGVLDFQGFRFRKYSSNDDTSTFMCIYKNSNGCPGIVEMLNDKIIRYSDHLCSSIKNFTSHSHTVLMYCNRLTSNPEVMYKDFTYTRILRTSHVSVWQCTTDPKANCTASIKIYTISSTLSNNGPHTCISKHNNDERFLKKIQPAEEEIKLVKEKRKLVKEKIKLIKEKRTLVKEKIKLGNSGSVKQREKAKRNKDKVAARKIFNYKVMMNKCNLPLYTDKRIIPVYNEMNDINILYQGYVYKKEGENWTCIQRSCKGSLHILNYVNFTKKHNCCDYYRDSSLQNKYVPTLTKITTDDSKELYKFYDHNKRQYVMYQGYVYQKSRSTAGKWICINHLHHRCKGVLTIDKNQCVPSHHVCRDDDKLENSKSLIDYGGYSRQQKNIRVDGLNSNPLVYTANERDTKLANKINNISKLTDEVVSIKKVNRDQVAKEAKINTSASFRIDEDAEMQIPSNMVDQTNQHKKMKNHNKRKKTYRKTYITRRKNGKEIPQYDESSEFIEIKCDSNIKDQLFVEHMKPAKEHYIASSAVADSKLSTLSFKEELTDEVNNKKNISEMKCQYDKGPRQFSNENQYYYDSTIKQKASERNEAVDNSIVKEENMEIETDVEQLSLTLSRGPIGEYLVHVGSMIDLNNSNSD